MKPGRRLLPLGWTLALLALLGAPAAHATSFAAVQGQVQIQRGDQLISARNGLRLREGDEVLTEEQSEALVRFDDGARLAVRPESRLLIRELRLQGPAERRQKTLRLIKGGLRYVSGVHTVKYKVAFETENATIGIRGTDIEIAVSPEPVNEDPAGTYLKVNAGLATMAANDGTQVDVDPGQLAFGGEPELVARGLGLARRPAARKVPVASSSLFKTGLLDRLMK